MKKTYIIYKLTSPSGKSYIGQTTRNIEDRVGEHFFYAAKQETNHKFYNALKKYPNKEDWLIEEIDNTASSVEELNELEIRYIAAYDTFNSGYNSTLGGFGCSGYERSDEWKEAQSQRRKDYFLTEEGIAFKEQQKEKFKSNNPGSYTNPSRFKGRNHTEVSKKKIAEANSQRQSTVEYKEAQSRRTKEMWTKGCFDNRPKPTKEAIQKRIQTLKENGFKQSDNQKSIAKESNQSSYRIKFLDGRIEEFKGLKDYSILSNIPYDTLACMPGRGSKKYGVKLLERLSRRS